MNNKDWSLSEAMYTAFHQWHLLVIMILAGGLLGWLAGQIGPAPYRAQAQVYVALNPYRTYSDTDFVALTDPKYSNLDNYKYWQMSQLQTVITLPEFFEATLEQLRRQDPDFWSSVEVPQLQSMLSTEWRSAGRWDLVAESDQALRAEQASRAWSHVSVERVEDAIWSAQSTFMIDQELQALAAETLQAEQKVAERQAVLEALGAWQEAVDGLPAGQPIPAESRGRLLAALAPLDASNTAVQALFEDQPAAQANLAEYQTWAAEIKAFVENALPDLKARRDQLAEEKTRLEQTYRQTMTDSLGLSPNLEIEEVSFSPAMQLQPAGLLSLIGGLVGLLAWVLWVLARLNARTAPGAQ